MNKSGHLLLLNPKKKDRFIELLFRTHFVCVSSSNMGGSRWGTGGPDPLKNLNNIVFFSTVPDPLKNHKATKPAFNVGRAIIGPPAKRHLNGVSLKGR